VQDPIPVPSARFCPAPVLATLALVSVTPHRGTGGAAQRYQALRRQLVAEIAEEVTRTADYLGKAALDPRVMAALGSVPREAFVPEEHAASAYDNAPLPIGAGQTISQPYIVAVMTDMLEPRADDAILEVGTGCGYQAAVLAALVARVYSIETIPELGEAAAARLERLGYANVEVRIGDGALGWPEHAPFDGIIVTAAAAAVPPALVAQLKPGRRLVVPVGAERGRQELMVIEKSADGAVRERVTLPVAFVPLVSGLR